MHYGLQACAEKQHPLKVWRSQVLVRLNFGILAALIKNL